MIKRHSRSSFLVVFIFVLSIKTDLYSQTLSWQNVGLSSDTINSLAVNSSDTVFVGTNHGGYFSSNKGNRWLSLGVSGPVYAYAFNLSGDIFVGTLGGGVYRSINNGVIWKAISVGLTDKHVICLAINSSSTIFT